MPEISLPMTMDINGERVEIQDLGLDIEEPLEHHTTDLSYKVGNPATDNNSNRVMDHQGDIEMNIDNREDVQPMDIDLSRINNIDAYELNKTIKDVNRDGDCF